MNVVVRGDRRRGNKSRESSTSTDYEGRGAVFKVQNIWGNLGPISLPGCEIQYVEQLIQPITSAAMTLDSGELPVA